MVIAQDLFEELVYSTSSPIVVPSHTKHHSSSSSSTSSHHHHATPTWIPSLPEIEKVGASGERTLWVVFVAMLVVSLIFGSMAYKMPTAKRLFHVLTTLVTVFATLSYFAMAVGARYDGHGSVFHETHDKDGHSVMRQVFYARFIDWSLTLPLLTADLALLAGMNGADMVVSIVSIEVMVACGLFGVFGKSKGEFWGWFVMGCLAYLVFIVLLATAGLRNARTKNESTRKLFTWLGAYTLILWTAYPFLYAFRLSVDQEIVAYAVLDVLSKAGFGFILLWVHKEPVAIEGFWSKGLGEGNIRLDDEDGA